MNNFQKFALATIIEEPQSREALLQSVQNLFTAAPPDRLRDTLMEIYQVYLMNEHGALPLHFPTMAGHVFVLLETLRQIELTVFTPNTKTE